MQSARENSQASAFQGSQWRAERVVVRWDGPTPGVAVRLFLEDSLGKDVATGPLCEVLSPVGGEQITFRQLSDLIEALFVVVEA